MEGILSRVFFSRIKGKNIGNLNVDNLSKGKIDKEYKIIDIKSNDVEMDKFLFSLGCYEGEEVTLISVLGDTYVIKIKNGRYSIDKQLAAAIKVEEL